MNRWLSWMAAGSLLSCSASLRRPVQTTDAAGELEEVTRSSENEFNPAVSPDGSALAYDVAAAPDAPPHVEVVSLGGAPSLAVPDVAYGTGETVGLEPAWMPDGSGVLFVSSTPRGKALMQMVGHGPGAAPFIADVADHYFTGDWPAVSPDGATVAMSVGRIGVFRTGWPTTRSFDHALGVSDLLGTGVTVIGEGTQPAWSPDGKRLAFVRSSDGHQHVFIANADGTDAQAITEGSADDEQPTWSPDGASLVFCSAHGERQPPVANLFRVNPDGSGLVQLTEGDAFTCRPAWGRDGFVYFHTNTTERFHIWRIRPK